MADGVGWCGDGELRYSDVLGIKISRYNENVEIKNQTSYY